MQWYQKKYSKHKKAGHTLLESLICIILLSLVSVGGFYFFMYASEVETMAIHKKIATEIVSTKMEELRTVSYSSLVVGTTTTEDALIGKLKALTADSKGLEVVVSYIDDTVPADGKKVNVKLSWSENFEAGKDLEIELVSYFTL